MEESAHHDRGLSRPRRVLSRCQDFSKAYGGRPRPKNDTINIADRKIKHHSLAASQVTYISPADLGYIRAWVNDDPGCNWRVAIYSNDGVDEEVHRLLQAAGSRKPD
jgi:hypothetical protein